jgi:hypothetical protein
MNITLQSIKMNKALSEETLCFSATMCVNGKPAFTVKNHGTGGRNLYMLLGSNSDEWAQSCRLIKQAEKWARESTKEDFEPLDSLIAQLLDRHEITRILKAGMKKKIMMLEQGELMELKLAKGREVTPTIIAEAKKRYKDAVILNDLPLEEAVGLVLAA